MEQIVERSQTRAIAGALLLLRSWVTAGRFSTVPEALQAVESAFDAGGLDALGGRKGDYARPRRLEVAAALNRLRGSNPPAQAHGARDAALHARGGPGGGHGGDDAWGGDEHGSGGDEAGSREEAAAGSAGRAGVGRFPQPTMMSSGRGDPGRGGGAGTSGGWGGGRGGGGGGIPPSSRMTEDRRPLLAGGPPAAAGPDAASAAVQSLPDGGGWWCSK